MSKLKPLRQAFLPFNKKAFNWAVSPALGGALLGGGLGALGGGTYTLLNRKPKDGEDQDAANRRTSKNLLTTLALIAAGMSSGAVTGLIGKRMVDRPANYRPKPFGGMQIGELPGVNDNLSPEELKTVEQRWLETLKE